MFDYRDMFDATRDRAHAWSARCIYTADGQLHVLPNRQSLHGAPDLPGLNAALRECKTTFEGLHREGRVHPGLDEAITLLEGGHHVAMCNPRASHGYLYLVIAETPRMSASRHHGR